MSLLLHFFGGFLAMNGLPHLVSGVQGRRFPSFGRGADGLAPPLANVLWGSLNIGLGLGLLHVSPAAGTADWLATGAGCFCMAIWLSLNIPRMLAKTGNQRAA